MVEEYNTARLSSRRLLNVIPFPDTNTFHTSAKYIAMTVKSDRDLQKLLRIGKICGTTLKLMQDAVRPGISTAELNEIGARHLEKHGARSAPIVMYNFPADTCISINDEAAHGIPGERIIRSGDLVNIDVSAELDGIYADTGGTVMAGTASAEGRRLCDFTRRALNAALNAVTADKHLYVIGQSIEQVARQGGYSVIRELGGHGVGRSLHEQPRNVPNYFTRRAKGLLNEGLVMTIEPFLTTGSGSIFTADDGWTLKTRSGKLACQFEHTVIITRGKPILVTAV
jgi:methionyl aminopeptidase